MIPAGGCSERELLSMAYVLEKKSEHPLARAILLRGQEDGVEDETEAEEFQAVPGNGLSGRLNGASS